MELLVSLYELELQLMVKEAKERCISGYVRNDDLDEMAMDIGFTLGSRNIRFSSVALSVLTYIETLSKNVHDAFVYAYNGTLRANNH
ncbi:hypothetical protein AAFX24_27765 [Vibrio mediterranei]|uniref:hypothetical protein n=1 Tax=Vibrio mediterranei TaxID=689 RepID=UPI0038CEFF0F